MRLKIWISLYEKIVEKKYLRLLDMSKAKTKTKTVIGLVLVLLMGSCVWKKKKLKFLSYLNKKYKLWIIDTNNNIFVTIKINILRGISSSLWINKTAGETPAMMSIFTLCFHWNAELSLLHGYLSSYFIWRSSLCADYSLTKQSINSFQQSLIDNRSTSFHLHIGDLNSS